MARIDGRCASGGIILTIAAVGKDYAGRRGEEMCPM